MVVDDEDEAYLCMLIYSPVVAACLLCGPFA